MFSNKKNTHIKEGASAAHDLMETEAAGSSSGEIFLCSQEGTSSFPPGSSPRFSCAETGIPCTIRFSRSESL